MNRQQICIAAALCLACLGLAAAAGGAKKKAGQQAGGSAESTVFQSEKAPVEVTIPPGGWQKMTPDDMGRESPFGCLPAAGAPEGLYLTIHRPKSQVAGSLTRLPQSFLMRNEEDIRSFIDDMKEAIKTRGGEGAEVLSSELSRRDGLYVHRMEFLAQPQGAGGCGGVVSSKEAPARMRYVIWDYFVRPAGEEAGLYRVSAAAPEDSYGEYADMLETFGTSFRFTGERAESFFEPGASEKKLPQVQPEEGQCGAFDSPALLIFGVIIVVLWWWSRYRGGETADEETGEAGPPKQEG